MPKVIELTVEINIQRVSCPGVWLCQDGRVSLTVFALGTSYQTCLLPPNFPLMFKDVFYFRKRFQETCALNNICCLLKDETIYCELVQWCQDCVNSECNVLAQYLGSLSDVLFPPNMCTTEGVDLLMRRSKEFPGILSPKIEVTTKVRIDEMWRECRDLQAALTVTSCRCSPREAEGARQKPVCHSAQYHRTKCSVTRRPPSASRCRSRSRSASSRSCENLAKQKEKIDCCCPNPISKSGVRLPSPRCQRRARRDYCVYNVQAKVEDGWRNAVSSKGVDNEFGRSNEDIEQEANSERIQKILLESRFVDEERYKIEKRNNYNPVKTTPCVCEICKRYHELFHNDKS